ncbi:MAG: TRAP transporter substrate-binding protein [Aquisalimonadaceae bacterium]
MLRINSKSLTAMAVGLGLLAASAGVSAQTVTLRVHHFLPAASPAQQELMEPWAERVERDSDGRIDVQIFPSMQLGGSPGQLYNQVRDGVVDIVWTLTGYTPGRFHILPVFELPFMATTAEATSQATTAFALEHLQDELADVHPLLVHVHAPGFFHTREKAVRSIADLDGMNIRAPTRPMTATLELLGANPVGMPVPEVSQSLSTGVIDGAVIPWEVARPLRIQEVVDHHTEFESERGLYTATFLFLMNRGAYERLPEDLRQVIDDNSMMNIARDVGRAWDRAEGPGREAAVSHGNNIYQISADEAKEWEEATRPVIDEWIADMNERGHDGEALYKTARDLIDRYASN